MDLAAMLSLLGTPSSASSIFDEVPELGETLKPYHPIKAATVIAGLLTEPSLLASNLRLEALIHLLLSSA